MSSTEERSHDSKTPSENWRLKILYISFAAFKAFLKVSVPSPESTMVWRRNLYRLADNLFLCLVSATADTMDQKLLLTWVSLAEVGDPLIQGLPVP